MIEPLLRLIARFMARIRVNRVAWLEQEGNRAVVKRRRFGAAVVIWFGNRFLTLAQSGVQMFVRSSAWIEWEQHCFRLLYADFPQVVTQAQDSIALPTLPGTSLRQLLHQGCNCPAAFVAAARELRRAHRTHCYFFHAGWSHGDLHLDNILYDRHSDRAFLIDFDTRHLLGIDANRRHADDVKVLLLELLSTPGDEWRDLATTFLSEYAQADVLHELAGQMAIPQGFAKILWHTRTDCRPDREIAPRIRALQETIDQLLKETPTWCGDTPRSQRQYEET